MASTSYCAGLLDHCPFLNGSLLALPTCTCSQPMVSPLCSMHFDISCSVVIVFTIGFLSGHPYLEIEWFVVFCGLFSIYGTDRSSCAIAKRQPQTPRQGRNAVINWLPWEQVFLWAENALPVVGAHSNTTLARA